MKEQGIKLRRRKGYTAAPNTVIVDTRISPEARLMLIYMMSCSEDWVFYRTKSMEVLCCGKEKYQRIIRELKETGYLIVRTRQGRDGRLDGQEWEIVDDPETPGNGDQGTTLAQDGMNSALGREPENTAHGTEVGREPENPPPGDAHREPGFTARRFTPPAGKPGPLRNKTKKETKHTSCADNTAPKGEVVCSGEERDRELSATEAFERIAVFYPKMGSQAATVSEMGMSLVEGVTTEELVTAAKAYAEEQKGNDRKFVRRSDRFFKDGFWRAYARKQSHVDQAAILAQRAKAIISKANWVMSLKPSEAGECIMAGLVTPDQCRSAGISL